jgi:hypothetical protein
MTDQIDLPKDGKGYATDIHEIIKLELRCQMKPFIDVVVHGQEELKQGQKTNNQFIEKTLQHDTWIKGLGASQFIMALVLFLHWIIGR